MILTDMVAAARLPPPSNIVLTRALIFSWSHSIHTPPTKGLFHESRERCCNDAIASNTGRRENTADYFNAAISGATSAGRRQFPQRRAHAGTATFIGLHRAWGRHDGGGSLRER